MPSIRTGENINCGNCGVSFYVQRFRLSGKWKRVHCSLECAARIRGTSLDPIAAFWLKVEKRGPDECWGWKAQKRWDGYGRFVIDRKPRWAHRFSYELHHGTIAAGKHVLHSCDNPECTNPRHLSLGDQKTNMADMYSKRRHTFGEKNPKAYLNEKQVLEIRRDFRRYGRCNTNLREIAARFPGLSDTAILYAANGRSWKHLPMPKKS